jgi:indolepyruvate ferredoxin oxidoreductase alpha subunit
MDNSWVAMTGHQPSPSAGINLEGGQIPHVDIESILKSLGVPWIRKGNPFKPQELKKLIKEAITVEGLKAILVEGECTIQTQRRKRLYNQGKDIPFEIDLEKCIQCGICFFNFGCPAIVTDEKAENFRIQREICIGCGACVEICSNNAIARINMVED